ncbi:MAG TPA: hypothetical protein VK137_18985, partial [Planctomycetaceae bacterium]|nr:hypothetical protein [Planctomycetaceae bacterium]
ADGRGGTEAARAGVKSPGASWHDRFRIVDDRRESLPLHHRNPFDRVLITLALQDERTLVSVEVIFGADGVDHR